MAIKFLNTVQVDTDVLYVDASSNRVGIGTTSPTDKLHVSAGAIRLDNFYQLRWGGTGTGIYGHSTQGLNFYTDAGTTRLKIENGGNVGIGTTNPSAKLEVSAGVTTSVDIAHFSNSNNIAKAKISLSANSSGELSLIDGSNNTDVFITSNGNSYFNGGNVGIGTTSPTQKLQVNGRIRIPYNSSNSYYFGQDNGSVGYGSMHPFDNGGNYTFDTNYTSGGSYKFKYNGTEIFRLRNTGAFAFGSGGNDYGTSGQILKSNGNASPTWVAASTVIGGPYLPLSAGLSYPLTGNLFIEGASTPKITITDTTNNLEGRIRVANNYMYIEADTDDAVVSSRIVLRTDGVEALYLNGNQEAIFPNGNVGIGVTGPDAKLDVRSDSRTAPVVLKLGNGIISGDNGIIVSQIRSYINNSNTAADELARIQVENGSASHDDGNLSFWTRDGLNNVDAAKQLQIGGRGVIDIKNDGTALLPVLIFGADVDTGFYRPSANNIALSTSGEERIRVISGGNVGIGTTLPGANLDVRHDAGGTVRIGTDTNNIGEDAAFGTLEFYNGDTSNSGPGVTAMIQAKTYNQYSTGGDITFSNKIYPSSTIAERMRIDSDGKVGVGTVSPSAKFHVEDPTVYMATAPDVFKISQRSPEITIQDLGTYLAVDTKYKNGAGFAIVTHTVQANPGGEFNKWAYDTGGPGGSVMEQKQNSFHWSVNNSQKLTLNSLGYLGINDTTPGYSLDVNGNGRFTSTVTATNFILSSDERLKENIEKVCNNKIKVDWKTFELKADKGQKRYGVIAQELEKTNPEFVREEVDGFKSVAYIDLLIAKIAELEARLEKLEK